MQALFLILLDKENFKDDLNILDDFFQNQSNLVESLICFLPRGKDNWRKIISKKFIDYTDEICFEEFNDNDIEEIINYYIEDYELNKYKIIVSAEDKYLTCIENLDYIKIEDC